MLKYVIHQSHLNFIKRSYILKPFDLYLLYLDISYYLNDIFLKSKKNQKKKKKNLKKYLLNNKNILFIFIIFK